MGWEMGGKGEKKGDMEKEWGGEGERGSRNGKGKGRRRGRKNQIKKVERRGQNALTIFSLLVIILVKLNTK